MFSRKNYPLYSKAGLLLSIPFFLFAYLGLNFVSLLLLLSLSLFLLFLLQFSRKINRDTVISLSLTILGLVYIIIPMVFFIYIRQLNYGKHLVLYLLLMVKTTDIAAYLIGTVWGRHPLIPRISPKKSLEGFIAGLLFCWLVAYLGAKFLPVISLRHVPMIGLISGILSQLGDFMESLIKRDCGVKDSGSTIPGIGGVLDIIDSILFALPAYYLYLLHIGIG